MGISQSSAGTRDELPPGAPPLGTLLADKYRLEGVLGVGGMGVVYRSNHALLGVPVAVKIILPEFAARPEFVTRFTNEARAAARIQSDHIARVSDVGTTNDGVSFLVMELLDGEDLGSVLAREGPQETLRCVDWMLQTAAGLSDAHAAGIVHRDLKPSNLFLVRRKGKGDRIKICDFGISKGTFEDGAHQLTKTNTMLGSPAYMAPEQLRSSRTVDARADLWSLGIILYELLTGSTPFSGDNVGAVFAAILENDPLPPRYLLPALPEELDHAILRCLRRSPNERFASAADLALALAPFASDSAQQLLRRRSDRPQSAAYDRTVPHDGPVSHPMQRSPVSASGPQSLPISSSSQGGGRVTPSFPSMTQRLPSATPAPSSADVFPRVEPIARTDPSRLAPEGPRRPGVVAAVAAFALVSAGIGAIMYSAPSSKSVAHAVASVPPLPPAATSPPAAASPPALASVVPPASVSVAPLPVRELPPAARPSPRRPAPPLSAVASASSIPVPVPAASASPAASVAKPAIYTDPWKTN